VSDRAGIIHSVHGIDEVSSMPEFVNWVVKPAVGDRLSVTTDLRSAPYIVELRHGGSEEESLALIERVRSTIGWNHTTGRQAWLRARARDVLRRAPAKLEWLTHDIKKRFARSLPS
jgi:hypothetical protein